MDHEQIKPNGANVVIEKDDRVLIQLGSYGKWMLPGGGVERAELPVHAAMEEVLEETGLIVMRENLKLIALLVQKVKHDGKTQPMSGIVSLYRCSVFEGTLFTEPTPEVVDWRFVTMDEALGLYDTGMLARSYMKMLIIHDSIKHGLLEPVHEAVLADRTFLRPTRII